METYNFWKDLLDTYQSLSAPLQFAWLLLPPAFLFAFVWLVFRYGLLYRRLGPVGRRGMPVFTIYRNIHGSYDVYSCLLYTSPSPRDGLLSRMPSSA